MRNVSCANPTGAYSILNDHIPLGGLQGSDLSTEAGDPPLSVAKHVTLTRQ